MKFLSLQPQVMSAYSSVCLLPYNSSGCHILNGSWILVLHIMSSGSLSFTFVSPMPFIFVMTADDTLMPIVDVDSVVTPHLSLSNIYLIPKLKLNLAFVGQLCDSSNYLIIFFFFFFCVLDLQSYKLISTSRMEMGLYILDELKVQVVAAATIATSTTIVDLSPFRLGLSSFRFYL